MAAALLLEAALHLETANGLPKYLVKLGIESWSFKTSFNPFSLLLLGLKKLSHHFLKKKLHHFNLFKIVRIHLET